MASIDMILNTSRGGNSEKRKDFKVQMISLYQLHPSKKQFYLEEDIEELAAMIHLAGEIKQNLVVRKTEPGAYEIIAGHKRRMAAKYLVEKMGLKEYTMVPCKVEDIEDLQSEFELIVTNSTQRERTDWEKLKEVERMREIIPLLPGNEELKGRALRETIAKITRLSKTKVGQLESISRNLTKAGKKWMEEGKLNVSAAESLASLPTTVQEKMLEDGDVTVKKIKEVKEAREKSDTKGEMKAEVTAEKSAETGVGTEKNSILFASKEHKNFYLKYLPRCRYRDIYHKVLVYCLGIDKDTRNHVDNIYDFKTGYVKTECLNEGWQTSGSVRIVRLAFNLYCGDAPSVYDYEGDSSRQMEECRGYTVDNLFCCSYARYFWEAVKLRYPDYV